MCVNRHWRRNDGAELLMGQNGSNAISTMSLATSLIGFLSDPLVCVLSEGLILDSVLTEVNPSTALELGTYCGYSTVRIARLLSPGSKLITLEFNPAFAAVARQIIAYAGLQDKVRKRTGMQRLCFEPFSLWNCIGPKNVWEKFKMMIHLWLIIWVICHIWHGSSSHALSFELSVKNVKCF